MNEALIRVTVEVGFTIMVFSWIGGLLFGSALRSGERFIDWLLPRLRRSPSTSRNPRQWQEAQLEYQDRINAIKRGEA